MQHLVTTFFDTCATDAHFDTTVPRLSPPLRLPALAKTAAATAAAAALAIAAAAAHASLR